MLLSDTVSTKNDLVFAKNNAESPLLSRRKAAARLGVSTKTIFRWERAGLLTAIKINSRVTRYYWHEVEKLVSDAALG